MHSIEAHPDVYNELESARSWYEEKSKNLGSDFLDEIDRAISNISESPEIWPKYYDLKDVRRFLIHRFPFGIIYRYNKIEIQIIAVSHLSRQPGYWKERL